MAKRSQAREVAFQVLYQDDLNPRNNPAITDAFIEQQLGSGELVEFARWLVTGARRNRPEIDARLADTAEHWTLDRMAATDRNVLRLAAFEILHTDTPPAVAIDEAVELARRFGTAQSGQFVNGILDRLVPQKSRAPDRAGPDSSAEE